MSPSLSAPRTMGAPVHGHGSLGVGDRARIVSPCAEYLRPCTERKGPCADRARNDWRRTSAIGPDRSLEDPVSVRMLYGVPKVPFLGAPLLSGFISSVHQRFAVPLYETWNRLHRPIVVASALTDMVVAVNARAQSALTDSVQGVEGRVKVKVQGAPH
jgi:hypothetical protein